MKKAWAQSIQMACPKNEVAFFFKQWGRAEFNDDPADPTMRKDHPLHAKGGCQLDGRVFREFPASPHQSLERMSARSGGHR
jgi:protein gp37